MAITKEQLERVAILNLIDEELKKEGFINGLDYEATETFCDECLEALDRIKEHLIFKYPSNNLIPKVFAEIEDDIEEQWCCF